MFLLNITEIFSVYFFFSFLLVVGLLLLSPLSLSGLIKRDRQREISKRGREIYPEHREFTRMDIRLEYVNLTISSKLREYKTHILIIQ